MAYTKQDCIDELKKAGVNINGELSLSKYRDGDYYPSASVIIRKFESWNKAKEEADINTSEARGDERDVHNLPGRTKFSKEEWEELTNRSRARWKKRFYVRDIKLERGCNNCGFEKSPHALSFHHINPEEKFKTIAQMVRDSNSYDDIDKEIEKCEVLCANCHRIEEHGGL